MTAPTADQIARQVRWEMLGVDRAIRATREAVAKAEANGRLHELPSGQKLLREVVPPLIKLLEVAQAEALLAIGNSGGGRPPGWLWPVSIVEPARLAVITVSTCLRAGGHMRAGFSSTGGALTHVALAIADAVKDQVDYETWTDAQAALNKDAKDYEKDVGVGPMGHHNLLRAFQKQYPAADRRTWKRWETKIKAIRTEKWDKAELKVPLGMKLIDSLLAVAGDRFEMATVLVGNNLTQKTLSITEKCRHEMQDVHARMEVARPRLMPMLIPPIPWRYED